MLRIATLLVITLALSAPAIAGEPAKDEATQAKVTERTDRDFTYRNASERLRGKPYAVRTNTQPASDLTASERVFQFLPAANFMFEGRQGLGSK